jgi:hypothetical protein
VDGSEAWNAVWTLERQRQIAEPGHTFLTKDGAGGCGDLADRVPQGGWGFRLGGKFFERCGAEEHFVGVAEDAGPTEVADAVEDFNGTGAAVGDVTCVQHEVGGLIAEVGQDRFEGGAVSVEVRKYGDAHRE